MAALTKFLEIEPNSSRYRLMLGKILLDLKQPEKALAQFSFVSKKDQFNADALLGFAKAASQVGLNDKAIEALERGRARYPSDRSQHKDPDSRYHPAGGNHLEGRLLPASGP